MRSYAKRVVEVLQGAVDVLWRYLGSLGAVCLLAAVLGLGIYHAVVQDVSPRLCCYAGVCNMPGALPPEGIVPLGTGEVEGVPHVRLEYGADGSLLRMRHVNAEGNAAPLPGSKVAEQRLFYQEGENPLLVRKENCGVSGQLVEDAQGVAVCSFDYNADGRLVRTRFCNSAGQLVQPRFPGYAECRVEYDAEGRPQSVQYLSAEGKPVVNAAGEEQVRYEYGEDGSVKRSNFVAGKLAANACGVAVESVHPQEGGTCCRWYDAAGNPAVHGRVGAAVLQHEKLSVPGVTRRRLMDEAGEPCHRVRVCAEHLMRCNAHGQPEWECYAAADGMPVEHPALGYAERVCEYSRAGHLEREYFWDAAGKPAPVCEARHVRTPDGVYTLRLHADGATSVQPEPGG